MSITIFCKCGNIVRAIGQRYCKECHNAYMRENRKKHKELSEEQRFKANARSYANTYQKRGKLEMKPCENCGSIDDLQKHHENYNNPLDIKWLCKKCHNELHKNE